MNKSVYICSLLVVLGMAYSCSSRPVNMQHHHSKRSTSRRATPLSHLLSLVRNSSNDSYWNILQDEDQWGIACVEENRGFCELFFFCDFMAIYELMSEYTDRCQNEVAGFEAPYLISNMTIATEHLCKLWVSIKLLVISVAIQLDNHADIEIYL